MEIGKLLNPVYIYQKRDHNLPRIKQVAVRYMPLRLREKNPWSTYMSFKDYRYYNEKDGREIINATVGGKLEIFKRKTLEEIVLE